MWPSDHYECQRLRIQQAAGEGIDILQANSLDKSIAPVEMINAERFSSCTDEDIPASRALPVKRNGNDPVRNLLLSESSAAVTPPGTKAVPFLSDHERASPLRVGGLRCRIPHDECCVVKRHRRM